MFLFGRAMGRQPQFEVMTNDNFYKDLQVGPLVMGAMVRNKKSDRFRPTTFDIMIVLPRQARDRHKATLKTNATVSVCRAA